MGTELTGPETEPRRDSAVEARAPSFLHGVGATLHGLIGWQIYLFWTVVVGVFIALGRLGSDPLRRFGGGALSWCWGRFLWWSNPFWWREWRGLEHLDGAGPFVIVANHQSTIDIPCLYGLPLPLKVSARPGIFHVKVMGPFLLWSGQVNTEFFFEEAKRMLDAGISVVVFPEGSRSPDGSVQRFRSGAFKLATQLGVPILPVTMDGAQYIMRKGAFFPTRPVVTVKIQVLEPVLPGDDPKVLSREVRTRIEHALHELRQEAS